MSSEGTHGMSYSTICYPLLNLIFISRRIKLRILYALKISFGKHTVNTVSCLLGPWYHLPVCKPDGERSRDTIWSISYEQSQNHKKFKIVCTVC